MIVYLAYTSIYIARINLSIAGPEMMNEGVLDTVQLGLLGSVFSTVYALGRLANGSISDGKPPWVMLTTGLVAAGVANILIGFFPPFVGIFLLWSANAYAQSMLWSSVLCVVSKIYDKDTAKKKTSLMVTSVAMGNILGILINTFIISKFGTEFAFFVPGAITVVLGVLVLIATRNIKSVQSEKHISMFKLLTDREILTMSVPAIFHGVMKENISLWMTAYIVDSYNVDLSVSSYYILLIPIIGFLGRIIYPVIYNITKERENSVSVIGFVFCCAASVLLIFKSIGILASVILLSVIYAAVSVINTSMLSIYPMRYLKSGNVASVSGIMDFATYLGSGVSSVIYGVLIKHFGYMPMFASWAAISLISMLILARKK